jgi:DNA-binding transcriptional ArsR family regulator
MKAYRHPALRAVSLPKVMQALSDPWRLQVVRMLIDTVDGELTCGDFPADLSKATRSHHFQVLREAGLLRMRSAGNTCRISLRRADIEKRFPGLLALVSASRS